MSAQDNLLQTLADLRARRDALDQAIEAMQLAITALGGEVPQDNNPQGSPPGGGGVPPTRPSSGGQIRSDAFFGMSASEAVDVIAT